MNRLLEKTRRRALSRQRGQVAMIAAVSMLVLLTSVGLAIDSGLAYLLKARLAAALDSAALEASRAASFGDTEEEQLESAREAAQNFFNMNFPDGFLGSAAQLSDGSVNLGFNDPYPGALTATINTQVPFAPTLMASLGFDTFPVAGVAATLRRDLDMVLVLDTSGSLRGDFEQVKLSAREFLNQFNPVTDRAGLVQFSTVARVAVPIRTSLRGFDRAAMENEINNYSSRGFTNSATAFWLARDQLNQIEQSARSTTRAIVFFSDGSPNTFNTLVEGAADHNCNGYKIISSDDTLQATPDSFQTPFVGDIRCDYRTMRWAMKALPEWFRSREGKDSAEEFAIVSRVRKHQAYSRNRPVNGKIEGATHEATWTDVARAARQLVEDMAAQARSEGILVFTLGLGPKLQRLQPMLGTDETGENVLKCMANAADAPVACRNPTQIQGEYCFAASVEELGPCFSRLASALLRITR